MTIKKKIDSWLEKAEPDMSEQTPSDAELRLRFGEDILEEKEDARSYLRELLKIRPEASLEARELKAAAKLYRVLAAVCLALLIVVLVVTASYLPAYGERVSPHNNEVYTRYTERATEETGAVNIVAGVILDYRAFDTLGESNVLFCAVSCVFILLQKRRGREAVELPDEPEEADIFDIGSDPLLRSCVKLLFPVILCFGVYIILGGHLGAGGGFAGGAVLGAGLILYTLAFGEKSTARFFSQKTFRIITVSALSFYALSKSYSFYTGANGIESVIPKGTAGNILSSGLILPLNIAVGLVVACTIYGFYSVFQKGDI